MIVAIASIQGKPLKTPLAANLALLRARSGRTICLIDVDPRRSAYSCSCARSAAGQSPSVPTRTLDARSLAREIEELTPGFSDLLINTGEVETQEARPALIAARVVLVPVQVGNVDLESQYPLIARLNSARMFNPSLKVLFVIVSDGSTPSPEQLAAVRLYVAHVMSATLVATVLHAPCSHDDGQGRCASDAQTCDPDAAAELHALYREIYTH
ncbi:hypothetical protein CR152_10615 [Massilia violaceinigra]|uniref:CobQ/CobB/MinD/ParA nucleotide binding domain-containing protein n=1 Tax=Massilia violaceinigra TaxID=2045208 RepID=A0A2D2DIX6_9BURK|nr:hypothetical protein [Massilia violaceinigra]ATQ74927.1 hypothetical protein CR152_10615 [Massilia violaceinigra]